jgi:LPS export ABC transporter protein LptC
MMDRISKLFPYLLLGFLIGIFLWAAFFPKTSIDQTINKTIEAQKTRSDLAFKKILLQEIVKGKKYWEIHAITAWMNNDLGAALLSSIEGVFLKDNKPSLRFTAPEANWDLKNQVINLKDPRGFNPKDDKLVMLESETLQWRMADKKIASEGKVLVRQNQFVLKANNLEGDLGLKLLKLFNSPTALIYSHNRLVASLEAKVFEFDSEKGIFKALGGVVAHYTDSALRGPLTITSDQATYNPNFETLTFLNQVKITSIDINSKADAVALTVPEQLAAFNGNVELKYQGNQVIGNGVLVYFKTKKMKLLGKTNFKISEEQLVL